MARTAAHLGQHFLASPVAVAAMVAAAHIDERSTVLEIGPGQGVLTEALLAAGARVVAIEKDPALALGLRGRFAGEIAAGKLVLIEGDTRDHAPDSLPIEGAYAVAANIPYYITGEIIRTLLTAKHQPTTIALLIQKEVAQRIVARDGKESILSLSVKAYGVPRIVRTVPAGAFRPAPSVDSAILAIEDVPRAFFGGFSEDAFFRIVKAGFAEKRKQLGGNLKALASAEEVSRALASAGIDPTVRAEDVALQQWAALAMAFPAKQG
ncbi:MAG TPA: 16S rRNA (adenine(1518)-N(6)/adenine(1519)-N(6))-dimethyltransferase RsmA [Candidatus Paceibacterota bacterium]|nr:16S rRNA (adenine(1518)-N(6)/adenine(1519)-N(6))-dimethyltransferase RsmA [Candidatus Paceibacterota bacterium]